jgi:hypothetical protein
MDAPWTVIKSDCKKRARLGCMVHFLNSLDYPGKDTHVVHPPDPLIVGKSAHVIHGNDSILGTALHPQTSSKKKPPEEKGKRIESATPLED